MARHQRDTHGLLRRYLPGGANLARHSAEDLAAVAAVLSERPHKTLAWRAPTGVLTEHLERRGLTIARGKPRARHPSGP